MNRDTDEHPITTAHTNTALAGTLASDAHALAATVASGEPPSQVDSGDLDLATVDRTLYADRALLAEGGMGKVVVARDRRLGRRVAIKELRVDTPATRARFEREAMLTAQLEHPGIVAIHEAGRWPSGEPFYAMRVVAGRSFDRVLATLADTRARLAHVPTVLAVADAIAYAHGEGVIHRDLKPHNVMVGEFGEVVVIDWGLAKRIGDTDAGDSQAGTAKASNLTIAGAIVGTPAYVAPEQARGHDVDRRADVYSLGVILYELLAGRAPYRGRTADEILAAVIDSAPPPIAAGAGVPGELVAIVERAMARAPVDRYPSARELAEDLRRFTTGQLVGAHRYTAGDLVRRWLRRHRAAVATAAVAVVTLAVLGVIGVRSLIHEREEADHQRELADGERAKAEATLAKSDALAAFMQRDLRDQLATVNRVDLLEPIAREAIAYRTWQGTNHVATAHAYTDLADALLAKGERTAAAVELAAAIAALDRVASPSPRVRRDRSVLMNRRGDLLLAGGDARAAVVQYREALAVVTVLHAELPATLQFALDIVFGEAKLADALSESGDASGALVAARRGRAVLEQLAPVSASDREKVERELGTITQVIGEQLAVLGDSKRAIAELEIAVGIAERVAGRDPSWRAQRILAMAMQRLARVRRASGDVTGAARDLERLAAHTERAMQADPANAILVRDHFIARSSLGDLASSRGDHAAARRHLTGALALAEQLATRDANDHAAVASVATAAGRLATAEHALGQRDRARDLATRAMTLREQLVAKAPANREWRRDVIISRGQLAKLLVDQRDFAGARRHAEAAVALAGELAALDPASASAQRDLADTHDELAGVLRAAVDRTAALAAQRADLAIAERLAARDPANAGWQRDLAASHAKVGDDLAALGDRAGARASYDAALAILGGDPDRAKPIRDRRSRLH